MERERIWEVWVGEAKVRVKGVKEGGGDPKVSSFDSDFDSDFDSEREDSDDIFLSSRGIFIPVTFNFIGPRTVEIYDGRIGVIGIQTTCLNVC